jgi:hypothetical protein
MEVIKRRQFEKNNIKIKYLVPYRTVPSFGTIPYCTVPYPDCCNHNPALNTKLMSKYFAYESDGNNVVYRKAIVQ